MVGNVGKWVGDWLPRATCTGSWPSGYGGDRQGICGAATQGTPGALIRGGSQDPGTDPGPFGVFEGFGPSYLGDAGLGFRGAR